MVLSQRNSRRIAGGIACPGPARLASRPDGDPATDGDIQNRIRDDQVHSQSRGHTANGSERLGTRYLRDILFRKMDIYIREGDLPCGPGLQVYRGWPALVEGCQ